MIQVSLNPKPYLPQTMPDGSGQPLPELPAYKSAPKNSDPQNSVPQNSGIEGLSVIAPEADEKILQYRAAADVAHDLQVWKTAAAEWQNQYVTTRTGPDARNAAQETRAFHANRFEPLRKKYAADPASARYLQDQGSTIANQSLDFMSAYAQGEDERFVESVLAGEERELRTLMTSPHSTERERQEALADYTFKAENWRISRGENPEAVKTWKQDFGKSLRSETLQAGFERVLEQNPEQALTLIRTAKESRDSEYAQTLPPEQLQLMHNRAEAGQRNRLRQSEERTATIRAGLDASLLRAMNNGDFTPIRGLEAELSTLGRADEARQLTATRELMGLAQPFLSASRYEPFEEQRAGVREFFARPETRTYGAETATGKASGQDMTLGRSEGVNLAMDLAMKLTMNLIGRDINERENRFMRDPAGFVAGHPLLGRDGVSHEDFLKQAGLSQEEYIARSLQLQKRLGKGLGTGQNNNQKNNQDNNQNNNLGNGLHNELNNGLSREPYFTTASANEFDNNVEQSSGISPQVSHVSRVLPEAQAADLKDRYASLDGAEQKAGFLRELSTENGKYSARVMAESGLPVGLSPFAPVLPELSRSETAKLAQAAETHLDDLQLSDARRSEIRQRVAESPLVKALLSVDNALSGAETPSAAVNETVRGLESFVALGGNLPDLERRVALADAALTADIASGLMRSADSASTARDPDAPGTPDAATMSRTPAMTQTFGSGAETTLPANDMGNNPAAADGTTPTAAYDPAHEPDAPQAEEDTLWEQGVRGFGIGARGIIDSFAGPGDIIATPARMTLNWLNGLLDGDPDYWQPMAGNIPDTLGLPRPETAWENFSYNINQTLGSLPLSLWAGNALLTQQAASAAPRVPSLLQATGKMLAANPAGQLASEVGSAAALSAAQSAGAGPLTQMAAGMAGGMAGGVVKPMGVGKGGRKVAAMEGDSNAAEVKTLNAASSADNVAHVTIKGESKKTLKPMGNNPEEFAQYVRINRKTAVQQYIKDFGHHLDLDEARMYCGAYAESVEGALKNTHATHEPAGELINAVYEQLLKQQPKVGKHNSVLFGGGAGGSGKSTSLFQNPYFSEYLDTAHITYDTTLAGSQGLGKIDKALKAGKDVDIYFVVRDPLEAIISSFTRAKEKGRFIPLDVLVNMHISSRDNIRKAAAQYADDNRVRIRFVNNTDPNVTSLANLSFLDKMNYSNLQQRARAALEKEYKDGRISEEIYRGILNGAD